MNKYAKYLIRLIKWEIIYPEDFYSINITAFGIDLQGKLKISILRAYLSRKFSITYEPTNGYIELERGPIKITLTD